jgi:hypothetical protein
MKWVCVPQAVSVSVFAVCVALAMYSGAAVLAEDFDTIDRAPALRSHHWPTSKTEVIGYDFKPEAIDALDELTATLDTTSYRVLQSLGSTTLGHYEDVHGYRVEVTRTVKFTTPDSKPLEVRIRVSPSLYEAHRAINEDYRRRTNQPMSYWNLANDMNDVGDVCIIRDARFAIDDQTGRRIIHPEWDVSETKRVFAIYHNILLHIEVDRESTFQLLPLVQEIIADMETQRVAASGNPERPTMSLQLSSAQVESQQVPGASVNLSHSASWNSAACQSRFFIAQRVDNVRLDENLEPHPHPSQPFTYRSLGARHLDHAENPTKTEGWTELSVGHYHVVMVAWGDNLLPKVVYEALEVTD